MSFDPRPATLPQAERTARLRLIRTETVGPITFRHLLARYGSARAALEAVPRLARRGGRAIPPRIPSMTEIEDELDRLARWGGQLMCLGEHGYPAPLAAIDDAPPVLLARGHPHLAERTGVAVVGARNASAIGRKFAQQVAADLGQGGVVVVSGLARGVDAAAHTGALDTGTIAVVAGGIDEDYPRENAHLYDQIGERGLIVGEMPMGTRPQATHFPRRNRIISGLSLGVAVIEAAQRSGSLITARLAAEQGREVFAVPGSPLDPRAHGANRLIKTGATLIESGEDILEALAAQRVTPTAEPPELPFGGPPPVEDEHVDMPRARAAVRQALSPTPVAIDDIIRQCDLTTGTVLTILLELELAGIALRHPGNRVSLA